MAGGTTHHTEVAPAVFEAFASGAKRHDILRSETVHAGDRLLVRERDADGPTGRSHLMDITYVTYSGNPCALSPEGLSPGHTIVSLETSSHKAQHPEDFNR